MAPTSDKNLDPSFFYVMYISLCKRVVALHWAGVSLVVAVRSYTRPCRVKLQLAVAVGKYLNLGTIVICSHGLIVFDQLSL